MIRQEIKVSVIIVCMNNMKMLSPCLDSIITNTKVDYEIFVVAFLFEKDNLDLLHAKYPNVKIIENNEFKGFSENNNLALRQAEGKYCFVLNDDTYFSGDVIGGLVEDFSKLPGNVAIVSPKTLNQDGSVQRCGKPEYNLYTYLLNFLKLIRIYERGSKYTNQYGLFKTYNISGACFMIDSEVFKSVGFFDESFYFCPEDIALSTLLNEKGYECYVDADLEVTHIGGGSWSKTMFATKPAQIKGEQLFYGRKSYLHKQITRVIQIFGLSYFIAYWYFNHLIAKSEKAKTFYKSYLYALKIVFSNKTPKELFIWHYNKYVKKR